jgi:hypothetical protein
MRSIFEAPASAAVAELAAAKAAPVKAAVVWSICRRGISVGEFMVFVAGHDGGGAGAIRGVAESPGASCGR